MPFSNLPSILEKYEIFISNYETEIQLNDDQPSSASLFPSNVDLDISPLLFLRSPVAQIGLQHVTIENLCLCYLNNEKIRIKISTPSDINYANFHITSEEIQEANLSFFDLQFSDYSATNTDEAILYADELLDGNLSSFLIYRLALNFFDLDIFKDNIFSKPASKTDKISLSLQDIELCLRYTDFTLFTRRLFNAVLNGDDIVSIPPNSTSPITNNLTCIKPKLTAQLEKKILDKSRFLKSFDERSNYEKTYIFSTSTFENFYNIDLKSKNNDNSALCVKITTEFHRACQTFLDIHFSHLTSEKQTLITNLKKSNEALIQQGLTLQKILLIQREKQSPSFSPSLFASELVSIQKDESGSKTYFDIFNKYFLPNDETTCDIFFDKQASYTLGTLPGTSLHIGPLTYSSDCHRTTKMTPKLTANIVSSYQRLHGPIRNHPKILHIACDILSTSDQKVLRPINADYPNFQTIHSILVEDHHLTSRFFSKNTDDVTFHRMLKTETLLQRFHILTVDENERPVTLPRNSIFSAKFVIMPYTNELDR